MSDCNICCEKINKSVICSFCNFEACSTCSRRYLTDTDNDPHCMNCKKTWSRDFIDSSFPKTFINKDLKNHRENILIEREKSLLPSTQHLVEEEIHKRKYTNIINNLYEERKKLRNSLDKVNDDIQVAYNSMYNGPKSNTEEKNQFIKKCPAENCMGYLSSQWKCGICNLWTCPECHEIKGELKNAEHTCIEENKESAKMINKETKPCPNCSTRIFRIDGCDQMFCTNCQTPFSWKTGKKIISGVIHNPHYYQWMRENNNGDMPRQFGDIPCGGLPSIYKITELNRKMKLNNITINIDVVMNMHRTTSHIQYSEIPHFDVREINTETNSDLRIKYMLKEISEYDWKFNLQKREKKNNKHIEINQILQMFVDTSSDIFRSLIESSALDQIEHYISTLNNLKNYYNESLSKISKRYSCVVPIVDRDWIVHHIKNINLNEI